MAAARKTCVDDEPAEDVPTGGIAADRLRSIVERIERLEEERKPLGSDIKNIFSEAKSAGFQSTPHLLYLCTYRRLSEYVAVWGLFSQLN